MAKLDPDNRCGPLFPPATALRGAARWRGRRIGLLGGSFNPAHDGHRHISLEAMRRLRLDEVWWLVSPLNPLKSGRDMASLEKRVARARAVARHPRIRVMDLEARLGSRYTVDTVAALALLAPATRFVWLMGADNLLTFHKWRNWERLFSSVPVAILDRAPYSIRAPMAKAARRFRVARQPEAQAPVIVGERPPAWVFIHCPRHPLSATDIRARDGRWIDPEPERAAAPGRFDRRRTRARIA